VQRGAAEDSDSGEVQRMRAVGLTSILDRGHYLWLIPADADEPPNVGIADYSKRSRSTDDGLGNDVTSGGAT